MAKVEIEKIVKNYGALEVIHGISAELEDGQFMVLVGPSGCGKSTLLRMIAGLETVSGGRILIDGKEVNGLMPKERDIAMVFQNYALYPHMTVAENMGFALKLAGRSATEIAERVKRAAAVLDLGPYLERKPVALSGGQRQRVAMGRAIVRAPKVFLFDEPLSNLDAKLRVQMRAEIRQLHERLKTTTIYVTHDQTEAMTMADRIVVLNKGRVEQVGTPREVYETPVNLFVASFIGSPQMNIVGGDIARRLDCASVGVRPEHLSVARGGDGWAARIVSSEYLGSDIFLHAEMEDGTRITARVAGEMEFHAREPVTLKPLPTHVHRFGEDGRRI
ncbi:carbohydrate ABC transporter ATP-binding protein, CUT1 family [Ensifer adhaerens]|nr:carbohydrate ABC transporter ATP-binding protein, CUT1 family [Ensifer adhaerens]